MKQKFLVLGILLITFLVAGCSIIGETKLNQPDQNIQEKDITSTFLAFEADNSIEQTKTSRSTPTTIPTQTPTITPSPTPIIAQGHSVLSNDNVDKIELLSQIGIGEINEIAWSSDGNNMIFGTGSGIYIYDRETLVQEISIFTNSPILTIDISPDNLLLITGNSLGEIELWDISTRSKLNTIHIWNEIEEGTPVHFSPDGKSVASMGLNGMEYYVILWNLATGEEFQRLHVGNYFDGIDNFVYSPDGHQIAVSGTILWLSRITNEIVSSEKRVYIWDIETKTLLHTLIDKTEEDNIIIVSGLSSDNSQLWAAYSNNIIAYWDLENEELTQKRQLEISGDLIQLSSDGKRMAVSEENCVTGFYAVDDVNLLNTLQGNCGGSATLVEALKDERFAGIVNSNFNIYDIHSGEILVNNNYFLSKYRSCASTISPDGFTLAYNNCLEESNNIYVVDMASGKEKLIIEGHPNRVSALGFSPDHSLLAFGGDDNMVSLWDIETGTLVNTLQTYDPVYAISFSGDGQLLAVAEKNKAQIWDINSGDLQNTFSGYYQQVYSQIAIFSPDNSKLALGGNGVIEIYDVASELQLFCLEGHTDMIVDLAFSPDGLILSSAGDDLTLRFWDMETGDEIYIIEGLLTRINSMVFTQDATTLITGSADGVIRFWGIP